MLQAAGRPRFRCKHAPVLGPALAFFPEACDSGPGGSGLPRFEIQPSVLGAGWAHSTRQRRLHGRMIRQREPSGAQTQACWMAFSCFGRSDMGINMPV